MNTKNFRQVKMASPHEISERWKWNHRMKFWKNKSGIPTWNFGRAKISEKWYQHLKFQKSESRITTWNFGRMKVESPHAIFEEQKWNQRIKFQKIRINTWNFWKVKLESTPEISRSRMSSQQDRAEDSAQCPTFKTIIRNKKICLIFKLNIQMTK